MTNLDSILKSRDITLPTKIHLVKAMVFPVVNVWMWDLDYKENWALKNWCFWTVVLEKTLESPLDCKEIHPVSPKETSPEYSLEGLMLKLKLQYFGHLMRRADSLEKTLMLGKIEGRRRRGRRRWDGWMASRTQWTWVWINSEIWWWTERPGVLKSLGWQTVRHDWATELNWCVGRCKSLGSLKAFLSYASPLSGVSILQFFLSAHYREWLQPDGCWITGIILLPSCP